MSIQINKLESRLKSAEVSVQTWKFQYESYGDDAAHRNCGRALFAAAMLYSTFSDLALQVDPESEFAGPWAERSSELQNELLSLDHRHLSKKERA
jgi:hypothetical protein